MRKQLLALGAVAMVAMVLANPASAASRGATFTPIGLFPMCDQVPPGEFCDNFPLTTVVSMTGDGQTIVGMHAFFSGGYRWTKETGLQNLGPVNGGVYIARGGSEIASTFFDDTFTWGWSAIWAGGFYPNMTWDRLPLVDGFSPCGGSGQSLYGISGDATTTVGLTWIDEDLNGNGCDGARAFVSSGGVTTVLDDSLSGTGSYRANTVNGDGSVIAGWSAPGRTASLWLNDVETYICDGAYSDWFCNEAWDITPDGSTILFTGASPDDFNVRASVYDVATGDIMQLPFPDAPFDPFFDSFQGWSISDDGKTVVGEFGGGGFFGSPPYPVLWNEDLGFTLDVHVFLLGQGLDDLFFWFLDDATEVNSDGTIIAGSGVNPDGWIEAWTADISKVKVCHKPDGNGTGNTRTIAIGWESVSDHLGHGDILSTCEFARAGGNSRAMAHRAEMVGSNEDPSHDSRMGDLEMLNRIRERAGQSGMFGSQSVANPYPTDETENDMLSEGGQSREQRRGLSERIGLYRGR
jgi:hypothetical protein